MANDLTGVPPKSADNANAKITLPKNATPYPLSDLKDLQPPRTAAAELNEAAREKNILWHSFLWSYDRLPYMADFMQFNKLQAVICSHSATPYH